MNLFLNVPRLKSFNGGKLFNEFIEKLEQHYHVSHTEVYCPDYGVPQKRNRLVVLASKHGPIKLLDRTHQPENYVKVSDAIGKLQPIIAGEICNTDPMHRASNLSEINLERIRQSKQGGTWLDWDKELITECHRKDTGKMV